MDADTTMVRELVDRLLTALLTAHRWQAAPGHGTDRAADDAVRLVAQRDWHTARRHRVPCRHRDDGAPGTCEIATTLERTPVGGAVLHLAANVTADDGPPRGGLMHTSLSGAWGGWGTNRPLGLCEGRRRKVCGAARQAAPRTD